MKPKHNQVFCLGCQKYKMLFESQSKADNFIRYNSENILEESGKAPIRSYYCEFCGGYHVTSNPSSEEGERFNKRYQQRMDSLSNYLKGIEKVKSLSKSLSSRLETIKSLLFIGEVSDAEHLLNVCELEIEDILTYPLRGNGKITTQRAKIEKMKNFLAAIKDVRSLSDQDLLQIISKPNSEQYSLSIALNNMLIIQKVDDLIEDNELLLQEKKNKEVSGNIKTCRELLENIKRAGKKVLKGRYNILDNQEKKIIQIVSVPNDTKSIVEENRAESPQLYVDKEEYRSTLLSIIERLESIQKSYEDGDIETCESELEICDYLLDELQITDDNIKMIKERMNYWLTRIRE